MRLGAGAALVLALAITGASTSSAAVIKWSKPVEMPGRSTDATDNDQPPPVAVNSRGDAVVAWIDEGFTIAVAVGNRRGFRKPVYPPIGWETTVAIAPQGHAIAGFNDASEKFHEDLPPSYAVIPVRGKVGRTHHLEQEAASVPKLEALPNGSFLALYTARDRRKRRSLRAQLIGPSGKPGRRVVLGRPEDEEFGWDAAADGRVIVCCEKPSGRRTAVWTFAPKSGWSNVPVTLGAGETLWSVTSAGSVQAATVYRQDAPVALLLIRKGSVKRVPLPAGPGRTSDARLDASGRIDVIYRDDKRFFRRTMDQEGNVVRDVVELPETYPDSAGHPWQAGLLWVWAAGGDWHVVGERDGAFSEEPAPEASVYWSAVAWAPGAVALSWYDLRHRAHVSIGRP
jgi:hypothetical protein